MSYTVTINPQPQFGSNSTDGYAGRFVDELWAAIIAGGGNQHDSNNTRIFMRLSSTATTDQWGELNRGFLLFYIPDVNIPVGSIVESAKVSLQPQSTPNNNFSTSLTLTDSDPAIDTGIGDADYQGGKGTVEYTDTRVTLLSMTGGVRFEFDLNAAGIAALETAIAGQEVFKTGIRYSHDFDNTEPTWVSAVNDSVLIWSADNGSLEPYLEITFRVGPGYATVKVTGEKGNSADGITIDTWVVEIFS